MTRPAPVSGASRSFTSSLEGDRPCVTCGFNLIGQSIVREEHYGMLIARCPECGGVAPLMEYPGVSKWTRRLMGLMAALLALAMIGVTVGSGGAMFGVTIAGVGQASEDLAHQIEFKHAEEVRQSQPSANAASAGAPGALPAPHVIVTGHSRIADAPKEWVARQDLSGIHRAHGGWDAVVREYGVLLIPLALASVVAGAFLGITALHQRRWRLAALGLLPIGVFASFLAIATLGGPGRWQSPSETAAFDYMALRVGGTAGLFALVVITVAILTARPIARAFIRLMLPPRLRAPLYPLWEADGLPPPRARRATRA